MSDDILYELRGAVAVITLNGAAASGAMSGDSIGVIANRYRSLFLPADYVFGIWSLIYLGLIASAIYQALPTAGAERAVTSAVRMGASLAGNACCRRCATPRRWRRRGR